jgi:hypothetical protein
MRSVTILSRNHGGSSHNAGESKQAPYVLPGLSNILDQAHDHARAASTATQTADTTVAVNEHTLAAGEFAKAAEGTSSAEALRTLKLLEQHHKKLSQLLKFPTENPVVDATSEKTVTASAAVSELRVPKGDAGHTTPRRTPAGASSIHIPRRMPPRDMSSSIASNLATARGIRSTNTRRALSPSVSTQQAPGSLEVPARRNSRHTLAPEVTPEQLQGKPSWVPPMHSNQAKADSQVATARTSAVAEQAQTTAAEEGFQRFYSTVESLLSKLSAPLAFAGLPLISEEAATPPEAIKTKETSQKSKITSNNSTAVEPDLTKFISRAALRASSAHPNPGSDSFYVVPKTGHTATYANILSFAEKEKRRMAASLHSADPELFDDPDQDEFVDARETPMPRSPGLMKRLAPPKGKPAGVKDLENVIEELYTENKSLKDCIDKLSKRLHAFEMSAQSSTLALQESIRLMAPASPTMHPTTSGSETEGKMIARIKALEEQVGLGEKELQILGKENEKLKTVVARYRERWEKLKEGAKTRREGGAKEPQAGAGKEADPGGRFVAG